MQDYRFNWNISKSEISVVEKHPAVCLDEIMIVDNLKGKQHLQEKNLVAFSPWSIIHFRTKWAIIYVE